MPVPRLDPGRLVALGLSLAAGAALVIGWMLASPGAPRAGAAASRSQPIQTELRRCSARGELALGDARCRAAWDVHRRRFLEHDGVRRS